MLEILAFLIIGVLAGWIAGLLMRGYGFGLIGNMVLGIVGAVIGGMIFNFVGVAQGPQGFLASLATATIGAVVLLGISKVIRKA